MNEIRLVKWLLEVDVEKTREFYKNEIAFCTCLYCENYMEACKYLDLSVMEVFTTLGITPSKPSHLSEFGEMEDGLRSYSGSYHVVGKLIEGEYCTDAEWNDANTAQIGNFTFGFDQNLSFVQNDFPLPVLQVSFEVLIPWLLNENPED